MTSCYRHGILTGIPRKHGNPGILCQGVGDAYMASC